jgi:hypothetical protein
MFAKHLAALAAIMQMRRSFLESGSCESCNCGER